MLKSRLPFVAAILFLSVGCGASYTSLRKSPMGGNLKAYPAIAVGWMDLGEQKYQTYGFTEKDKNEWFTLCSDMNLKSIPQYMKDAVSKKNIYTAKSKTEPLPNQGLIIIFTEVDYKQQTSSAAQVFFGGMAGSDGLEATVHFIDGPSQRELYSETVAVTSKAGMGYSSWGFGGRVNNAVYNLVQYVAEQIQ
jgi:hypothetical protein